MKEMGSEFWTGCTPLDGQGVVPLLPKDFITRFTLCGRTGLEIIVSDIIATNDGPLKVYLPSYCCHTMIEPFTNHNVEVEFYDVVLGKDGIQKCFHLDNDCDIVFLMDYFGYIDPNTAEISKNQKEKGKVVIYDATHSFFCNNLDYSYYDYIFGSFRKWVDVNAGFCSKKFSWIHKPELSQNLVYTNLRNYCFAMKAQFMAGEDVDKQIFLKKFSEAEEDIESVYRNYAPDDASLKTIQTLNTDYIRTKRRENAEMLIKAFAGKYCMVYSMYNILAKQDCPLFVPLDIRPDKRAAIRMHLVKNSCYLPIHWPVSDFHSINEKTSYLYEHELSCICDQRYDKKDMERLIEVIKSYS